MMPYYDNPRFHGREKILGEVANVLTLPSHGAAVADIGLRSFALSGPGGIGKSQVAGKFVYQHKDAFDAIFWVHADSVGKLQRSLGRIAVSLGLVDEDSTDAQDEVLTRDLVLGWLGQPLKSYRQREHVKAEEASCLIVFDNADELHLLDEFWHRISSG
jgi:hypothetical protein